MWKKIVKKLIFMLVLGLLIPITTVYGQKEEVIDQSTPMGSCGYYNTFIAQSFKPTLNSLTKVEIPLFKQDNAVGTVTLSIREKLYGEDLVSQTLSVDEVPLGPDYDWVIFDFGDMEIKPGQKYFMVFTLNNGTRPENSNELVLWTAALYNPYWNGRPYIFYRYLWLPLGLLTGVSKFPDMSFRTYGYQ